MARSNKDYKYFFIHVPKTAGTSFRSMLHQIFEESEVYPTNKEIQRPAKPYVNVKVLRKLKPARIRKINLFHGHMPHFCVDNLNYPIKKLTFLRDPLQRTISNLYHLQRNTKKYTDLSISEILETEPIRFDNRQTRYFINSDFNTKKLKQNHLDTAKFNLEKLDFLGITEMYEDSIKLLSKTFEWKFEDNVSLNKNTSKTSKKYIVEKDLENSILEITQLDQELYTFATQLLTSRLK